MMMHASKTHSMEFMAEELSHFKALYISNFANLSNSLSPLQRQVEELHQVLLPSRSLPALVSQRATNQTNAADQMGHLVAQNSSALALPYSGVFRVVDTIITIRRGRRGPEMAPVAIQDEGFASANITEQVKLFYYTLFYRLLLLLIERYCLPLRLRRAVGDTQDAHRSCLSAIGVRRRALDLYSYHTSTVKSLAPHVSARSSQSAFSRDRYSARGSRGIPEG